MQFPVIIREINVPARAVILKGRSLPYRPVGWGREQRLNVSHPPGSPVASTQVIGPTCPPTTMRGKWKDVHLFDPRNAATLLNFPALRSAALANSTDAGGQTFYAGGAVPMQLGQRARTLRDATDLVCKCGGLLKVEWISLVRYGFLKRVWYDHDREEDIEFELEFEFIGDSPSQPKRIPPKVEIVSLLKIILAALDKVIDKLLEIQLKIALKLLAVTQLINKLGSIATGLLGALTGFAKLAQVPANIVGTIQANLVAIQLAGREFFDAVREAPSAAIRAAREGNATAVEVAMLLEAEMIQSVRRLVGDAIAKLRELLQLRGPALRGVEVTKQGQTLYDVARKYFRNPDYWKVIAQFNGISTSVVPARTVLRIPSAT